MKIISGHLTPLDRRALAAMLAAGQTTAKSARKRWTIERHEGNALTLRADSDERDDYGRPITRTFRKEIAL